MNSVTIAGNSRIVALIGDPVAHSVSPVIHNHLFAHYKLPLVYIPLKTSSAHLRNAITMLRDSGFAGANITIPHKQAVLSVCDTISDLSQKTDTVNTLYWHENRLRGTTTDAQGFFTALAGMKISIAGKKIMILGNGGTARTLAYALSLEKRCAKIVLAARTKTKADLLAHEITNTTSFLIDTVEISSASFPQELAESSLLVNCTPVGMHPNLNQTPFDVSLLTSTTAVFDTIYNPAQTMLLKAAKQIGSVALNGLPMLLHQGLASFTYWTGISADTSLINLNDVQALTGSKT
jgi:shikimate dehydrogenase